ncbi:amidase signature enzyme [Martensiomyces pterosporus]|nr:amidase signature enzyme [Martensiomyces pterosporus]
MTVLSRLATYVFLRPLQLLLWSPLRRIVYLYIRLYNRVPQKLQLARKLAAKSDTSLDNYGPVQLLSATELARRIRSGKLSSVAVVNTYIERIKQVNPLINAVVADRFEDALAEARLVDQMIASGDIPDECSLEKKPFLGVPVTIKESNAVKGMPNTHGLAWRKDKFSHAGEHSEAVGRLVASGLIVLGVTNIPELLMAWESDNTLYGRSFNPYDLSLNTGGSSSGEGAILGAGGSVIGLGSDIGGSIRMPAFFCGVFGHKTTAEWIPRDPPSILGHNNEEVYACATFGPLCRYAEDIAPFVSVLIGRELGDPLAVDLRKLRVVAVPDGLGFQPFVPSVQPDIRDAIVTAANYLGQQVVGHGNVFFSKSLTGSDQVVYWYSPYITTGEVPYANKLGGENLPAFSVARELIPFMCGRSGFTGNAFNLMLMNAIAGKATRSDIAPCLDKMRAHVYELLGENGVLLFPPHPTTAQPHGVSYFNNVSFIYTGMFNILGLPVTQVPLGLNKDGMPLGVQVVARKGEDLKAIAVALQLEKRFGGWIPPRRFGAPVTEKEAEQLYIHK